MKLLKCAICGNIVEMVEDKGVEIMCCGKAMEELQANTSDGAIEKHVPVAEFADGKLHVNVGSMEHPMLAEHYITNIFIEFDNRVGRIQLQPGDKPEAIIAIGDYKGKIHIYEYCNIHGLWKTDIEI